MDLKEIHQKVSDLASPVDSNLKFDESPEAWFSNILKQKLSSADDDTPEQIRWNYVKECLSTLDSLKTALAAALAEESSNPKQGSGPRLPADALSVNQNQKVTSLLQMILGLGLLPNLIPGVGLPVEKRSKFLQFVLTKEDQIDVEEKYNRLYDVTKGLLNLCNQRSLSAIVMTKCLGDLLAALIQLGYAPLKKPNAGTRESPDGSFVMTEEKYEVLLNNQKEFQAELKKIVTKIYQPLVVKYLLVIQTGGGGSSNGKPLTGGSSSNGKPPPKWLKKTCGELLSDRLLQPNGVMNVIRGVLDIGGSDQSAPTDQRKFQIVASVIASPPAASYGNTEEYYRKICPQILELLNIQDDGLKSTYHQIGCASVRAITERSLILGRRYLLNVLMEPLLKLSESTAVASTVTEEELSHCIEQVHEVFVIGNDPSVVFVKHLEPVIFVLFELHCKVTFGVSHLKQPIEDLLHRYLKFSIKSVALATLRTFAFGLRAVGDGDTCSFRRVASDIRFVPGETGGIKVEEIDYTVDPQHSFYVEDDEKSIILDDLVRDVKDKDLATEFFMSLVKELSNIMAEDPDKDEEEDENDDTVTKLLKLEKHMEDTMGKLRGNLMVIRLLGLMSEDEDLQDRVFKNGDQMISFISLTLHRGASLCQKRKADGEDDGGAMMEVQSLIMSLTLLSVHVTQAKVKVKEWEQLQGVLEDLAVLGNEYNDDKVRSMSRRLHQLIATHGVILNSTKQMKENAAKIGETTKKMNEMADEWKHMKEEPKTPYLKALDDLTDPLVPVKGHGIIELTRLVDEKDEDAIKHIQKVLSIFRESLEDEDTYIYLSAIKGLIACANYHPELVIDLLTKEFSTIDDRKYFGDKSIELRTKIGEALVKVTRMLGDVTPKYKDVLLNTFLGQVNHADHLVRASSLSNLGEVCRNLRFSVGNVIGEILLCLDQCLKNDPAIEVRRAAVLVVTLLLQGLGVDSFRVLQSTMKEIYRTLKNLLQTHQDETLQAHATLALEEVDKIVKQFLQPEQNLTKQIYVLDSPPDPL